MIMSKHFYLAAFAAMSLVGCNEKMLEQNVLATEEVRLTVNLPQLATKVMGTPSDDAVNSLQIFVFNKYGVYETSASGSGKSLTLTCTTGEKQIMALVNADTESNVPDINTLRSRKANLSSMAAGDLIMSGETTDELTNDSSIEMHVKRLPSRVILNSVQTDFDLEQHKSLSFAVKSVFLINVAGDAPYSGTSTPGQWHNVADYDPVTNLPFLRDQVSSGEITEGGVYDTRHYFYCMPNSTETKTRLVVEAEIEGDTYYYPITLEKVGQNTSYSYNLTIKRFGSDSPDVPVEDGSVTFTVEVDPWVESVVDEII